MALVSKKMTEGNESKGETFDKYIATGKRKEVGLTRNDLAKILLKHGGNMGASQATRSIYQFECGLRKPVFSRLGRFDSDYILWLKEKGYNPYGLP